MRVNLSEPAVTKTTNFQRLGELRGLELALRNRGYLVSPLLSGDGLWIFSSNSNFDSLGTLCGSHETVAENAISVDNMTLHSMYYVFACRSFLTFETRCCVWCYRNSRTAQMPGF